MFIPCNATLYHSLPCHVLSDIKDFYIILIICFPLLARYFKAHSSFQATSTASERVFSVDKRVFDEKRRSLDPERGKGLVFLQEYLNKRFNKDSFRLCSECPQPPHTGVKYKISCAKPMWYKLREAIKILSFFSDKFLYGGEV